MGGFCYEEDFVLRLGKDGTWLDAARGIQQGDPLGPALFAMAMHEHIMAARAEVVGQFPHPPMGGLDIVGFYLDDGADAKVVKLFCDVLKFSLAEVGLEF